MIRDASREEAVARELLSAATGLNRAERAFVDAGSDFRCVARG